MKPRKIPLRKCTGCQEMKEKKSLIRVVKSDTGEFCIDKTGKKQGRGAYICPDEVCLQRAYKQKGFERSFKCAIPREVYEALEVELKSDE